MTLKEKFSEMESHKKFAAEFYNLVWKLLGKRKRTVEEDERMLLAAYASLFHWSFVGTALNLQRGHWLISHVYAILNRAEPALYHAKKCRKLTKDNNFLDFDVAYAYEAMARAYALSGGSFEYKKYIQRAKEAGEKIKNKEDRELFFKDLESGPWYGMKTESAKQLAEKK
jgi:hypothetical protein